MGMENDNSTKVAGARTALRTTIVKTIMDDERLKPVVEEVGDGGAGVFATHKVSFRGHELFVHSEEDAEFAKAAITVLNLALAVKFAGELTGEA